MYELSQPQLGYAPEQYVPKGRGLTIEIEQGPLHSSERRFTDPVFAAIYAIFFVVTVILLIIGSQDGHSFAQNTHSQSSSSSSSSSSSGTTSYNFLYILLGMIGFAILLS